jgi:hypothetical protein
MKNTLIVILSYKGRGILFCLPWWEEKGGGIFVG